MSRNFHENYQASGHQPGGPSDRSFCVVFAGAFLLLALWPLRTTGPVRWWALIVAGLFAVLAVSRPDVVHPLNRVWLRLGLLIGKVVNPVVMTVVFFAVFTPMGLIRRLLGKDALGLSYAPSLPTYWHERNPPGPEPESMPRQF